MMSEVSLHVGGYAHSLPQLFWGRFGRLNCGDANGEEKEKGDEILIW